MQTFLAGTQHQRLAVWLRPGALRESMVQKRILPDLVPTVLARFEAQLRFVDTVSFDLFDTLVQRDGLFSPKDLFYLVHEAAGRELGLWLNDYATVRVRAEGIARVRAWGSGKEEVTLDEIYAEVARLLDLDPRTKDDLMQIELDCERQATSSLESGKRLYEAALAAGKRIVVISDTYLPEALIAEIVEKMGYTAVSRVYASSAHGKSKQQGSLYDVVLRDLGCPPGRLLHVGDNQLTDVTRAVSKGIRSFFVPTSKYEFKWRHGLADVPSGNPSLSAMLCFLSEAGQQAVTLADLRSVLERTAIENLSVLYLGFSTWLLKQLRQGGYERVYFAARDGLIMKRFFDLVAAAAGCEVESTYLYVSRAALYPSLIFVAPETARRLFSNPYEWLTLEDALHRISLSFEECADSLEKRGLVDPMLHLKPSMGAQFSAFLGDVWPLVERKNVEHYALVVDYLRQEKVLTEEKAAFVDIGWRGSLQNSVLTLLNHLGVTKDLQGFYLGTFEKPIGAAPGFRATGFLVDNDEPQQISTLVRSGPSALELFHGAGHGCVQGYERRGARVSPVLEDNPVERQQFNGVVGPVQDLAFEFVSEHLRRSTCFTITAPEPGLVARIALRFLYAPTVAEAEFFGRLKHASDFGGGMKSITGVLEWDLKKVYDETLPDGMLPMWRPGFKVLKRL